MENKKVLSKKQLGLIALRLLNHRMNRITKPDVPQILKLEWRDGAFDGECMFWICNRHLESFFEVCKATDRTSILYDHMAPQTYEELTDKDYPANRYGGDRYLYVGMI